MKCTGDGTLSCFNGPEQAVRYALALRQEVVRLGFEMRAGVHVGEIVPPGTTSPGSPCTQRRG